VKFRVYTHNKDERTPRGRYEGFDRYDLALDCDPPGVWQTQTLGVHCECGHVETLAARPHGAGNAGWFIPGTAGYGEIICDIEWERAPETPA